MIAVVVGMVVLACAPATLDRLKWVARWPHWLLLGCVHRNHQMPRAAFTVVEFGDPCVELPSDSTLADFVAWVEEVTAVPPSD